MLHSNESEDGDISMLSNDINDICNSYGKKVGLNKANEDNKVDIDHNQHTSKLKNNENVFSSNFTMDTIVNHNQNPNNTNHIKPITINISNNKESKEHMPTNLFKLPTQSNQTSKINLGINNNSILKNNIFNLNTLLQQSKNTNQITFQENPTINYNPYHNLNQNQNLINHNFTNKVVSEPDGYYEISESDEDEKSSIVDPDDIPQKCAKNKTIAKWALDKKYKHDKIRSQRNKEITKNGLIPYKQMRIENINLKDIFPRSLRRLDTRGDSANWKGDTTMSLSKIYIEGDSRYSTPGC